MNFEKARFNMVEQQIRPWKVLDLDVLDLLMAMKREAFVPTAYRGLAFADVEIPLGYGAAMLAPKIEAKILQAVKPRKSDHVLEIGTGSGFMAALLAARSDHVHSVEIVPELAAMARANLRNQGVDGVTVEEGDGACGWAADVTYDVIVVTGSTPVLPDEFLRQLKLGGRLFAIVGVAPAMEAQLVTCVAEGSYRTTTLLETCVAPLRNARQRERFIF